METWAKVILDAVITWTNNFPQTTRLSLSFPAEEGGEMGFGNRTGFDDGVFLFFSNAREPCLFKPGAISKIKNVFVAKVLN